VKKIAIVPGAFGLPNAQAIAVSVCEKSMGGCFAYACTRELDMPILFNGNAASAGR
jgi:hypothetical protein